MSLPELSEVNLAGASLAVEHENSNRKRGRH